MNGLLVVVRDSGPGIDPEHLERVFEAVYTTKTSGVGMGLSICRSIINAHGGQLWAEPNEPRGGVFKFALPAGAHPLMHPIQDAHQNGEQRDTAQIRHRPACADNARSEGIFAIARKPTFSALKP
jgi:hypothetical protein